MTRDELLAKAAELFAERGFEKVTVREISEAVGANVAAVNYHFGDKLGLYRAIVEANIALMEETMQQAMDAGKGGDAEGQLRAFIQVFVERLLTPRDGNQIQRLMMREMENPTPMLDVIVERVMEPRMRYLCDVIGRLLSRPSRDRVVRNCAASVHAQCIMCKRTPVLVRMNVGFGDTDAAGLAAHITEFSLAAMAGLGRATSARPARSARAASPLRRSSPTRRRPTR